MSAGQGLRVQGGVERGEFRLEVEFNVAPGEVLGVLGPNGAGKTTLLRALAGLISLTDGHIVLDELTLDDAAHGTFLAPEHRPIGLVFQNYRLFPHLTSGTTWPSPPGRGATVARSPQPQPISGSRDWV